MSPDFGYLEEYAGVEAFQRGKPVLLVIGRIKEPIDTAGADVFLIGSCAAAGISNARRIKKIDNCFTTAVDIVPALGKSLGLPTPATDPNSLVPLVWNALIASGVKAVKGRYLQDIEHFLTKGLQKRI